MFSKCLLCFILFSSYYFWDNIDIFWTRFTSKLYKLQFLQMEHAAGCKNITINTQRVTLVFGKFCDAHLHFVLFFIVVAVVVLQTSQFTTWSEKGFVSTKQFFHHLQ